MTALLSAVTVSACRMETDFKCANNLCLPHTVKCDGHDQCGDGSDEAEHCGTFVLLYSLHVLSSSAIRIVYQRH